MGRFLFSIAGLMWMTVSLAICLSQRPVSASLPPLILDVTDVAYHVGPLPEKKDSTDFFKPVTAFTYRELSGAHEAWLRIVLPEAGWKSPALLFTAFLNGLAAYNNNRLIYAYGQMAEEVSGGFRYHMSHVIPINGHAQDKVVLLQTIFPSRAGFGEILSMAVGEREDMATMMVWERDTLYRNSIVDVCLGVLLLGVGIGAMAVFFVRFREHDYPFLSFGVFSIMVGLTYLTDSDALFFFNLSPEMHHYAKAMSFQMVPAGLFAFFGAMFYLKSIYARIVKGIWILHAILPFLLLVFMTTDVDGTMVFFLILVLNCTLAIGIILSAKDGAPQVTRFVFIAFFTLYVVLILVHVLEVINVISTSYDLFGWGMVALVAFLGAVLVRHYTVTLLTVQQVSLDLSRHKADLLELQKENLRSQLEALKHQVDPHFLFNSLSTLSAVIEEAPHTAVGFVRELSKVYRYVLQTREATLVTLQEELDFIAAYTFLLNKRYGANFMVTITVPERWHGFLVPPFSLQLLVENAVKHNVISKHKPLSIHIDAREGALTVTNTLQKKNPPMPSTHMGLTNIKNRYRLIAGEEIRVEETETKFIVGIPLITRKGHDHESGYH